MLKLVVALTVGLLLGSPDTARSVVLSAPAMYADALAKEKAVRQAMGSGQPSAAMIKAVRTVVSAYESLVRLYPASGYCDDALWNAAQLSIDASRRFGDAAQADSAAGLLKRLTAEYPTSKYARQAPDVLAVLAPSLPRPAPGSAAATPAAAPTPAPAAIADQPAAPAPLVVLRRIQRVALPDVVRLTLDLDAEVPFRQEELSGPSRLFFDFPGTTAASDLADRTIRFDGDADIVRQVRVGRQPGDTVRVVLETAGAASCSTSPLYTPYRLVIDCVRQSASRSAPEPGVSRPTPSTPATFARRAPAAVHLPPSAPIAARVTAPSMGVPAVLFARTAAAFTPGLPAGRPGVASSVLAALAAPEADPLPTASNIPPAVAQSTMPAPVSPARNLNGGLSMARQLGLGVSRIVIDPGHGGHDPGAKGGGVTEAALVLDIALRLEKLLQRQLDMEVILTRRSDEFVPLEQRTSIANREGADLFLSIHVNASAIAQAAGVETYFLNFATNAGAASVAARENAAFGQPMSALPDFVKAITLNNKLDESRDFATQVQRSLVQKLRASNRSIRDLGVKQAPFVVLIGASMPSALAEVSFVTNDREAKLLKGQSYRQQIAEALFTAVQRYKASLTRVAHVALQ